MKKSLLLENLANSSGENDEVIRERDLKGRIYDESKKIWKVALPSVIARVSNFGTIVVTQIFMGHVSSVDLAGYALVQTLGARFVSGVLLGMSSATETLCGQAYGAKQYHMMGVLLQRSWLIDLITMTIFVPALLLGSSIFKLLGQEEAIANSAGYISLWFIPILFGNVFSMTIQMFLQAQEKNRITAWLSVMQFAIHIPLSWLFVNVLNYGVTGAMSAQVMSLWFVVLGEFVYIFGGWCPDSWNGFSMAAFKDLFPMVKLSIGAGLMTCLELWYYAILVLVAGYMKNAEVAISAFSVCLNITVWVMMIIFGLLGAACVRVANELGRGDAKAVRFSIKVVLTTSLIIGLVFSTLCLAFGKNLGYLFTNDEEVARTVSDLSLLLALSVLLCSIYPVFSGIAIGAGLQMVAAVVNFVCFYLIGLPVGILLVFATPLQVTGLWIGLTIGIVPEILALGFITWRTNWDEQVLKTKAHLQKWYVKTPDEKSDDA